MRKRIALFLIGFLLFASPAFAALSKSVAAVDVWQNVAAATVVEGATVDVSPNYQSTLYIDCALSSTTAQTASTELIVQVSTATSGDDVWENLTAFGGPTGTAIKVDLGGDEAAAQTVLTVTNPATNNLDLQGKWIYMKNTADITKSELVYQTANSGDAGDTITVLDGITNAQTAADTDFYTIDTAGVSAVGQYVVAIPSTANRIRVIYNNVPGASAVDVRARIEKVTGL